MISTHYLHLVTPVAIAVFVTSSACGSNPNQEEAPGGATTTSSRQIEVPTATGEWSTAAQGSELGVEWALRVSPAQPDGVCIDASISIEEPAALGASIEIVGFDEHISCFRGVPRELTNLEDEPIIYAAGGLPSEISRPISYHYGLVSTAVDSLEGLRANEERVVATLENGVFMFVYEQTSRSRDLLELIALVDGEEVERCYVPAAPNEERRYPRCG